jgi:hypothetical protein
VGAEAARLQSMPGSGTVVPALPLSLPARSDGRDCDPGHDDTDPCGAAHGDPQIPSAIEHLVPGRSYHRFLRLLADPAFLYASVRVCQSCHIAVTQREGTRAADLGMLDMVRAVALD